MPLRDNAKRRARNRLRPIIKRQQERACIMRRVAEIHQYSERGGLKLRELIWQAQHVFYAICRRLQFRHPIRDPVIARKFKLRRVR